jgi:hypothetical protein
MPRAADRQQRERAGCGVRAGHVLRLPAREAPRPIRFGVGPERARDRLDEELVVDRPAFGGLEAPRRDAGQDARSGAGLEHGRGIELRAHAVVDHDLRPGEQGRQVRPRPRHAALARAEVQEEGARAGERAIVHALRARGIAPGRLDLDDFASEEREQSTRVRARDAARQLQYAQSLERGRRGLRHRSDTLPCAPGRDEACRSSTT